MCSAVSTAPRATGFLYEHADIPEGMTLQAWRTEQAAQRMALRATGRERRRRQRARRMWRWVDGRFTPSPGGRWPRRARRPARA